MNDILVIVVVVVFFALAAVLVGVLDRLIAGSRADADLLPDEDATDNGAPSSSDAGAMRR